MHDHDNSELFPPTLTISTLSILSGLPGIHVEPSLCFFSKSEVSEQLFTLQFERFRLNLKQLPKSQVFCLNVNPNFANWSNRIDINDIAVEMVAFI